MEISVGFNIMLKKVHILYIQYGENSTQNNYTNGQQLINSRKMRKIVKNSHFT